MGKIIGIPDKENYGDTKSIPINKLLTFVDQIHKARKAGPHHDIRFGDKELFSWATRYGLPNPGGKRLLFQQPIHSKEYADFSGEIPEGYGAGTVSKHDKGSIIVTEATDKKIKFVVGHKKNPEYFTMIKQQGKNKPWLMINHTPQKPEDITGDKSLFSKIHIKSVPSDKAESFLDNLVEGKVDGASALFKLKDDSMDVLSYRIGKAGNPIIHTERFFRGASPKINIPKKWKNKVLRGEIYSVDEKGNPLDAQKTSPILNMSLENSIKSQEDKKISLMSALFGVAGEKPNYPNRESDLAEALSFLPKEKFTRPPVARDREEAINLWKQISSGKHPEISEGLVVYPNNGGDPLKIKIRPEYDVQISGVFPGQGKYTGSAGGIEYRADSGVGRVGTGFDDDYRKWLWENREDIVGRIAKITSTKKLQSGKYYQPSFMSLHEDYPTKKAIEETSFLPDYTPDQLADMGVYEEVYDRTKPRLASLNSWPEHWFHPEDKMGWLEWYKKYSTGRRMEDDKRQIKRWLAFKARHGGKAFKSNPTPRRAYALRNWAIDPTKLVDDPKALTAMMDEYKAKKYNTEMNKVSFINKLSGVYVPNLYNKRKQEEEIVNFIKDKNTQKIDEDSIKQKLKSDIMNMHLWEKSSTLSFLPKNASKNEDELNSKKDKNKKNKSILPLLLLGGGLGLGVAGATMITPSLRKSLSEFKESSKRWATGKNPARATKEYVQTGSKMMRDKFWGVIPVRSVVEHSRKLPFLDPKDRWNENSASHYDSFVRGPLSGYLKLMDETMHETPPKGITKLLTTNFDKNIREKAKSLFESRGIKFDELNMSPQQQQEAFNVLNKFDRNNIITSLQQVLVNNHTGAGRIAEWGPRYTEKLVKPIEAMPWALGGVGALSAGTGAIALINQSKKEKAEKQKDKLNKKPKV